MSIRITTTLPAQTQLFSTSELICALNAAESRFNRAVRDAEITARHGRASDLVRRDARRA